MKRTRASTLRSRSRPRRRTHHRGGVTPLPLSYYDPTVIGSSANAGSDRLTVTPSMIRPRIGGGSRRHDRRRGWKRVGGFVPSIMEGFSSATAKYIAPLALMTMYKMMDRSKTKKRRVRRS